MADSLGIYIDSSMIKYARLAKEKDSIKVQSFNVLFYDNLSKALEQVIEEADAYKIPICTNIGNEIYGYAEVFAELSKKDIKSSVQIEFEMDCNDKNYNKDTLEMRYLVMADTENAEKYRALYIATEKAEISKRAQVLTQYKLDWMTPISRDIINLIDIGPKDDMAIINIEDETKITSIVKGSVSRVDALNIGMRDILTEINKTENSLAKSYEICKNITVYTQDMQGEANVGNEHLESVMPTLYKLVNECKKVLDDSFGNINRVLITGSATVINNIDLYFQEYLPQMKCEILRPYFLEGGNIKTSIKDYIEVNSAMALALDGLGMGLKDINYATAAASVGADFKMLTKKYVNYVKARLGLNRKKNPNEEKFSLKSQFTGPFTPVEKLFVRGTVVCLVTIAGLLTFSGIIGNSIKEKSEEVAATAQITDSQLSTLESELSKINGEATKYNTLISAIEDLNNPSKEKKVSTIVRDRVINKNSIPNLLTGIMTKIPQKVKLNSIKNTEDRHIVIEAQSAQYEQLGFFKGLITTNNLLTSVKSTSGVKDGDVVKITIEGDLP